ncbi:MAG: CPBP family intramembrane glutamic endopeptidase [Acutalibacteraceae bacterium]
MEKELDLKKIILTFIGFVIFWAVITNAWGYSNYIFKNASFDIGSYIYGYISRFIWVLPAILLIIKYDNKLRLNKKELFSRPKFNKSLTVTIMISLVYIFIMMLVIHKGFWFNSEIILWLVVIKYIIVGFVEEVVFRGWGYNSLASILSHKKATIITTIFFVLLHFASYFIKLLRFGTFDFVGIIGQSISALVWGIVFCWLLKKGKTIWNPIIAHTIYDLMYVLLVGGI